MGPVEQPDRGFRALTSPPKSRPTTQDRRGLFSLPGDVHYLNCAYMSPLLRSVEEAGIAGIRRKRFPGDIAAAAFFEGADRLRSLFSRLVDGDDPARVAILPAVS